MTSANSGPTSTDVTQEASSPYATGGGGTVLEHRYCATVLAAVLLEDPIPGLGDEFTIERVAFQASTESPVDDLLVTGSVRRGQDREQRRLAIGIRRDPTIGASDKKFVKLLADCLRTLRKHAASFDAGEYRLAIVVAAPHTGAQETSELTELARSFRTDSDFYQSINTPKRVDAKLRKRLEILEEAVAAAQKSDTALAPLDTRDLCWRLLRSLWLHQCRLEEDDIDRTQCVQRLRTVVHTASDADALFEHLCTIAAQFAKAGGVVDQAALRRALAGRVRIVRARSFSTAWRVLDSLADSLRDRTPSALRPHTAAGQELRIKRVEARESLVSRTRATAAGGGVLIVTGEPGVGKSALALDVFNELARAGASVTMLSLRDIEARSAIQFENLLGARLSEAFGSSAVSDVRLLLLDGAEVVQEGLDRLTGDLVRAARDAGLALVAVTRQDAAKNVEETVRSALLSLKETTPDALIATHVVEGFTDAETDRLVEALPSLRRLSDHPSSRWLLRRPGLLRLVLESDAVGSLPEGPLCEAIVYGLIWQKLIRRGERLESDGATPDGRDEVTKTLARRQLLPEKAGGAAYPDPRALPSLRADGVLLPIRKGLVWRTGDQFASDLLRDIAVVQVLLTESPQLLLEAGVPRWALHATRVAFQALLLDDDEDPRWVLSKQLSLSKDFADKDGERWADLPWEAALTVTEPALLLEREWSLLSAQRGQGLQDVMRVLKIRFGNSFMTDRYVGASVVSLLCNHQEKLSTLDYNLIEQCEGTILRWLRDLASAAADDVPNTLRARVRDQFILRTKRHWHDFYVESLGLLGPDLDNVAEKRLRIVAKEQPSDLHACLENWIGPFSLSVHRPQLLLELAEAYYVEVPDESDHPWPRSRAPMDYGVREHHHGFGGFAEPLAAWNYGPFLFLLRSAVAGKAIDFLNRLLDHAARIRVEMHNEPRSFRFKDEAGVDSGIDIELPGLGMRRFVGDSHVWRWYCGTSVGPYPCMSALMALEVTVDRWLKAGASLTNIANRLLERAENLAMAGFVYGMLVRHIDIDEAGELLEAWLAVPDVWRLELRRSMDEQIGRHWARAGEVNHPERRKWDAMTVASYLVLQAILKEDSGTVARLSAVGDLLTKNARQRFGRQTKTESTDDVGISYPHRTFPSRLRLAARASILSHARLRKTAVGKRLVRHKGSFSRIMTACGRGVNNTSRTSRSRIRVIPTRANIPSWVRSKDTDKASWEQEHLGPEIEKTAANVHASAIDNEDILVFRRWAGALVASNYQYFKCNESVEIRYVPPAEIVEQLKSRSDDSERGSRLYELQARYGLDLKKVSADRVREDLAAVISLLQNPPQSGPPFREDGPAALAMTALQMHAQGDLLLTAEELGLTVVLLTYSVEARSSLDAVEDVSFYSSGADRSAARALPLLLTPTFNRSELTAEDWREVCDEACKALAHLARSPVIEARVALVEGLRSIWGSPCSAAGASDGPCAHRFALELIVDAARYCRLGPWDKSGRRRIDPLPMPLIASLVDVPAEDLLKSRLATVIGVFGDCVASGCCVADEAYRLLSVMIDIYGDIACKSKGPGQVVETEARHLAGNRNALRFPPKSRGRNS